MKIPSGLLGLGPIGAAGVVVRPFRPTDRRLRLRVTIARAKVPDRERKGLFPRRSMGGRREAQSEKSKKGRGGRGDDGYDRKEEEAEEDV